jgi:hypothetical protein
MCTAEILIRWNKEFLLLLYDQTSWDAFACMKDKPKESAKNTCMRKSMGIQIHKQIALCAKEN